MKILLFISVFSFPWNSYSDGLIFNRKSKKFLSHFFIKKMDIFLQFSGNLRKSKQVTDVRLKEFFYGSFFRNNHVKYTVSLLAYKLFRKKILHAVHILFLSIRPLLPFTLYKKIQGFVIKFFIVPIIIRNFKFIFHNKFQFDLLNFKIILYEIILKFNKVFNIVAFFGFLGGIRVFSYVVSLFVRYRFLKSKLFSLRVFRRFLFINIVFNQAYAWLNIIILLYLYFRKLSLLRTMFQFDQRFFFLFQFGFFMHSNFGIFGVIRNLLNYMLSKFMFKTKILFFLIDN